jgi:hypothetical protein
MKVPYISRFIHHEKDCMDSDVSDSNLDDEAFCSSSDERKILKAKEVSKFGRKWTSKDNRCAKEHAYGLLHKL